MTVLNIYTVDGTENKNIIACLPEGKHIIGRGDLLKVTDKRVSRKHAIVEVSSDNVFLTSVHANPCFYRAANTQTLSVINQNQQSELNDGDQFALLYEGCWFKIKITRPEVVDDMVTGIAETAVKEKRVNKNHLEENESKLDSKRARLSVATHEESIQKDDNYATTSSITLQVSNNTPLHNQEENKEIDAQVKVNTSREQPQISEIKQKNNENDNLHSENKESRHSDHENAPVTGIAETAVKETRVNKNRLEENESKLDSKRARLSVATLEESIQKDDNYATASNITLQVSSNKQLHNQEEIKEIDAQVKVNTSREQPQIGEIKQKNNENDNVHSENKESRHNDHENAPVTDNAITPNHASGEPLNDDNSVEPQPKNDLISNDKVSNEQLEIKIETAGNNNQNIDVPSASGTDAKKLRRERCFYKEQCFRKNPHHSKTFSHPGDDDYDSDPNDDRPYCPNGEVCYVRNIDHRRQYKHEGRPAPQPSNVTNHIYVRNGCQFCEHCRRQNDYGWGGNEEYEDDVVQDNY